MSGTDRSGTPSVSVRFPRAWGEGAAEERRLEGSGRTVGELLRECSDGNPVLAGRLFGPAGEIRRGIAVFLNEVDVRNFQGEETAVAPGDRISIVPALPGG